MNPFKDSNDAYQHSFLILTTAFLGLSLIALLMEAQNVSAVSQAILQMAKSFLSYFQGRSLRFYFTVGGLIFFFLPSCLLILFALQRNPKQLKQSIDEEAEYWQNSDHSSTQIYPRSNYIDQP